MHEIYIGTAGWSIPAAHASAFPSTGTHLERYAHVLPCVEINSSFYRSHRGTTWARWAESTPDTFRFSVKFPRTITHEAGLICPRENLLSFRDEIRNLGPRLGPLLIQLPPSQAFRAELAPAFLEEIRAAFPEEQIALEPRHLTWFTSEADQLLSDMRIARVIADPPICASSTSPGGDTSLNYIRLHGSPRTYYSNYESHFLDDVATLINQSSASIIWCIFDNTALGHAAGNALELRQTMDNPENSLL